MTISPGSYMMVEPFLFTSTATGFWGKTEKLIDVTINSEKDVVEFLTHNTSELDYTVFVDSTVLGIYKSFIEIVGKPLRIHAQKLYFKEPVWSTWAQFYENVNQANVLSLARAIKQSGLPGHTIQIDDRWESNYGNMEFDKTKFPSPKKMVAELHAMGFKVALWVTLWCNVGTMSYKEGLANDYFLRSRKNPSKSLMCRWWNGLAGITDLGKPEAYEWAVRRLKHLQEAYDINGFKFDTRFYDERGKPYGNLVPTDYLKIGAKLVDEFNHVGVGVRLSWGLQGYGFTTRQHDKHSTWNAQSGLRGYIDQNLAISIIGYPFVTLDMTGGSLGDPPPPINNSLSAVWKLKLSNPFNTTQHFLLELDIENLVDTLAMIHRQLSYSRNTHSCISIYHHISMN
jgi:alpha-glucosidase (family GH31 glycosyl hydrolase)